MTVKKRKSTTKRKPQRNTLYLPTEVRDEVERLSVEVSYLRGKLISDSGFVQYLIKEYSQQAIQELIQGVDTGNDE